VSCGARGATAIPPAAPGRDGDPPAALQPPRPAEQSPVPLAYSFREHDVRSVDGSRRVLSVGCIHADGCVCTGIARSTPRLRTWAQRRGSGVHEMHVYAPCGFTHQRNRVETQVGVRSSASRLRRSGVESCDTFVFLTVLRRSHSQLSPGSVESETSNNTRSSNY
jgi:hypothetical protein